MTRNLVNGAVGGALATAVFSAVLLAGDRAGVLDQPPPKKIIRAVFPGSKRRAKPGEGVLATIAHFAYGSTAGALLGLLFRGQRVPLPVGAAYGLAVWYASYQHWVPRLGAHPPISRDQPARQAVLALGHVAYGTSLAISMNRLRTERTPGARILPSERQEYERSKFLTPEPVHP
jgi:hypothetical protein